MEGANATLQTKSRDVMASGDEHPTGISSHAGGGWEGRGGGDCITKKNTDIDQKSTRSPIRPSKACMRSSSGTPQQAWVLTDAGWLSVPNTKKIIRIVYRYHADSGTLNHLASVSTPKPPTSPIPPQPTLTVHPYLRGRHHATFSFLETTHTETSSGKQGHVVKYLYTIIL